MNHKNVIKELMPSILLNAARAVRATYREAMIEIMWKRDCKALPLTAEHKPLYFKIQRLCQLHLTRFADLRDCKDFNDRVQWLKLFDQTRDHIRCSDKLLMREYVRERVGAEFLTTLYQACESFDEIDFDRLPESFVMKTNHDSGSVILVHRKDQLDKILVKERLEASLRRVYGVASGEWAYAFIKPKILIEEMLPSNSAAPPPDYKFHCVDGVIKWLQYIYDRGQKTKEVIVSRSGQPLECHFDYKMLSTRDFRKPPEWENLCKLAETLSKGWKYVRIDLFCVRGLIYVGEMTFFPLEGCYHGEGQRLLGQLLTFERTSVRPPIYQKRELIDRGSC
jgi:hypothetical protein